MGCQLTMKADVYSFGVLVLEIISGRSSGKSKLESDRQVPSRGDFDIFDLSKLAWELHEEGKLLELVDPKLGDLPEDEVIRYMKVALFCTQGRCESKAADEPSYRHANKKRPN